MLLIDSDTQFCEYVNLITSQYGICFVLNIHIGLNFLYFSIFCFFLIFFFIDQRTFSVSFRIIEKRKILLSRFICWYVYCICKSWYGSSLVLKAFNHHYHSMWLILAIHWSHKILFSLYIHLSQLYKIQKQQKPSKWFQSKRSKWKKVKWLKFRVLTIYLHAPHHTDSNYIDSDENYLFCYAVHSLYDSLYDSNRIDLFSPKMYSVNLGFDLTVDK